MILWSRDLEYKKKLTVDDRKMIAKRVAPSKTLDRCKTINALINSIVCIAVLYFFNCSLIALAIAFVLTDAVLVSFDQLIFVAIPYRKTMRLKLPKAQARLEEVKAKRDELNKEIDEFAKNKCGSWRCDGSYCSDCRCTDMKRERDLLDLFIETEQRYVEKEFEKIKEVEIKEDKKQSKDYSDKKEYFLALREKLEYFVNKQNMTFLNPVLDSVILLIETLEKKPIGYSIVSNILYVYLDELQSILTKLVDLEEAQKNVYIKDIAKISAALSQNINNLIDRIVSLETEDIEVGIAVLLKELTESGGDENV